MVALDFLDSVDDHYIDSGHLTVDDEDEIITVPSINIQLKQQQITFLLHHYQFFSYIWKLWHWSLSANIKLSDNMTTVFFKLIVK